MIKFNLSAFC